MRTLSSLVLVGLVVLFAGALGAQSSASEPYTVAYASFGPLNSAIYVADADGRHERMLLSGSVLDMNPSFSPDGRTVLFTSRRNGSADIYRAHIDGSGLERLTDDPAFDDQAVMSPDGRRVAFVSSRSGQADVWVLDLASKGVRNLTSHPGGDYRPAWSPDGQWIAFTSDRDSKGARANTPTSSTGFSPPQETELYLMRPDGTGLRRLTDNSASVGGAAWSPDSARIGFYEASPADWRAMGTDFMGGPSIATSQIATVEVATGMRQVLTSGPGRKYSPKWTGGGIAYTRGDIGEKRGVRQRVNYVSHSISFTDGRAELTGVYSNVNWSPDGRRIVFHRSLDGTWPPVTPTFSRDAKFSTVRAGVYPSYSPDGRHLMTNTAYAGLFKNTILVMNPDGTNRRVVFEHPDQNALAPVWSPAGDRIAFGLGAFFAGGRAGMPAHLAVIAADGSGLKMLTSGDGNYGFPSWSPDGKRLVARSSGAPKGLVVVDAASGSVTPLTAGPQNDNFPAWSPKGDRILFASDRDGDWELYTIRSDGGDLKRLTNSPGNDAHATWSLDGEWIAFASARGGFKDEMPVGEGGGQGAGDIFVMRADGSDVRQLTDDAFEEATPGFAPGGPVAADRSSQVPRTEGFPRGCGTSVSERTTETGCYMTAATPLGALPSASVFWHLYVYPSRAAAEAIRGPHGTVVDSFGKYWVFTIAEERWRPASGQRVASIGPLTVATNTAYTARYMEAQFPPGAQPVGSGPGHRHPGPEAWYVLSGAQCLETPHGLVMASAGGTAMVPEGWPNGRIRGRLGDAPYRPSHSSSQLGALLDGDRRPSESGRAPCSLEAAGPLSAVNRRSSLLSGGWCIVAKRILTLVILAAALVPLSAQSSQSIQGVWRVVEITITDSPAGRQDPFAAFPVGTHTNFQPELMIFTGRHYSRTTDTAARPRPTTPYKTPGKPTLEELQAEWGPFVANAGTYEVSGTMVTLRAIVAKNPRAQRDKNFTTLTFKIEGNSLWLTPVETEAGPIPNPVTSKYVRVE